MKEVYRETFRSPGHQTSKADAEKVLKSIRELHSSNIGWVQIKAYVEQTDTGEWRAVREHALMR